MSSEPQDRAQKANQLEFAGATEPEPKLTKQPPKSYTYGARAEAEIEALREEHYRIRQERDTELERLRRERDAAIAKLEEQLKNKSEKLEILEKENKEMAISLAGLLEQNQNLWRERVENRSLDVFSGILIAVGGGLVSFLQEPIGRFIAIALVFFGAGILLLITCLRTFSGWKVKWKSPAKPEN